jgi:hypothetical protein
MSNELSADRIVREIETALSAPRPSGSLLETKLAEVRELQRRFRAEPLGGRLVPLKRAVGWFTASAFDRQAKIQEALLDAVIDLEQEFSRFRTEQHQRHLELTRRLFAVHAEGLALRGFVLGLRPARALLVGPRDTPLAQALEAALGETGGELCEPAHPGPFDLVLSETGQGPLAQAVAALSAGGRLVLAAAAPSEGLKLQDVGPLDPAGSLRVLRRSA